MNFTIEEAKTLFRFNPTKEAEFDTALTNALPAAIAEFQALHPDIYIKYANMPTDGVFSITSLSESDDVWTIEYDDTYIVFNVGENVKIGSYLYAITSIDEGSFTIETAATVTGTEFTLDSFSLYKNLFAWILLLKTTFTAEEMLIDIIKEFNKEFGDGEILSNHRAIESYRRELQGNIDAASYAVNIANTGGASNKRFRLIRA